MGSVSCAREHGLALAVFVWGACGAGCGSSNARAQAGASVDAGGSDGGVVDSAPVDAPSQAADSGAFACHYTSEAGAPPVDGGAVVVPADGGTPSSSCPYVNDAQFCDCLGHYDCGGVTAQDSSGVNQSVYCGACTGTQFCQPGALGAGVGKCGGQSPIAYPWIKEKIDMMVSMGEHDNTRINYSSCSNIHDGRGYTIGQVGFCTGTGDFILVAACYNALKPCNELAKYWGHRDASGKALDGLIYYNDLFYSTGMNQGMTTLIDKFGSLKADIKAASADADGIFNKCQDAIGGALYLSTAIAHATSRGMSGALTVGFLYDTELNFGEYDEGNGTPGTLTVMKNADTAYGAGLPSDFTGKTWEESRWLGLVIEQRAIVMSKDSTWQTDVDQNATWEAARRLHTAMSNTPESATDLGMDYDIYSRYKAGSTSAGGPCWASPPLATTIDSTSTVYDVSIDMSASATDPSQWKATGAMSSLPYTACPANPTP
jgi:hypothetical protein